MDHFFPPDVINALSREAAILSASTAQQREAWLKAKDSPYPQFVVRRLNFLPTDTQSADTPTGGKRKAAPTMGPRLRMATNLAMLSHMFQLIRLKIRELQKVQPLPNTPPPVLRYLLKEFTVVVAGSKLR